MIRTLSITIVVESMIVTGYCLWRKKPAGPVLLTSICGNLGTQSLLWIVLTLFFQRYLVTLLIAEVLIWAVEGFLLFFIPANHLRFNAAMLLSLIMNLSSFMLGWFLPV